jgi:hypothetical protein
VYALNGPIILVDALGLKSLPCISSPMSCIIGGGGGFDCTADGLNEPCEVAYDSLQAGGAVQCPNNNCELGTSTPFQCAGSVCGYMSNEFVSTHEHEWGGVLYSEGQWQGFRDDRADAEQQALADAMSYASNSPDGSNWDYIYGHLDPYDENGDLQIQGGHVDFRWWGDNSYLNFVPSSGWDNGGGVADRYGDMGAIHFNHGLFHLDTASPLWGFGLGAFLHGIIDVGFGNINPSVPF